MATTTYNIVLGASGSPSTTLKAGDKINYTNSTGNNITSFTLPSCVSPQTSPVVSGSFANGTTSRDYTVNNGTAKGDYGYSWTEPTKKRDTRSGTISVED